MLLIARASRWLLLGALLTSVASGLGSALLVASINEALAAERGELVRAGLEFAGLSVLVLSLRWLSQAQFARLSQATLARLRAHVSAHIAEAPCDEIERQGSARLLAVFTEDIDTVSWFLVTLPNLAMHSAVVLGSLVYLLSLSAPVFGFACLMVVLGSFGYYRVGRRADGLLRAARAKEEDLVRAFQALSSGAKELKLNFNRRVAFKARVIERGIETVRDQRTRGLLLYVASASWGTFLFFVVIGSVLFVLGHWLELPERALSGYALVFLYLMLPLEGVLNAVPALSRARIALDRIAAIGAERPAPQPRAPRRRALPFRGLSLEGVRYRHVSDSDDDVFALGPLDLELRAGEILLLVGGNGSGKTTLAKLLVGLYSPDAGRVLLDGEPVSDVEREAYRQHFAAVFADFHLFESLTGLDGVEVEARARKLLSELGLEAKVRFEGGCFSTTRLSQGQRKRLALLVALLEDRPVYVFDEWAADQEPDFKETFYRRLLPELKARGKAVVAITHDDRYFHVADRVLKLEGGRIALLVNVGAPLSAAQPGALLHST